MTKNRSFLMTLAFIIIIALVGIRFGDDIKSFLISLSSTIKEGYLDTIDHISNSIEKHFYQAHIIESLKEENDNLKMQLILQDRYLNNLKRVVFELNSSYTDYNFPTDNLEKIKVISYVDVGDFNKFWLDFADFNKSSVYGLLYGNCTAGIAISKYNKPMAILQKDKSATFSVGIGEDRIPGVIFGDGSKMVVKFIPKWANFKVGDEVFTSGMDNIFKKGIRVGKITTIVDLQYYKDALVEPCFKKLDPTYFYAFKKR